MSAFFLPKSFIRSPLIKKQLTDQQQATMRYWANVAYKDYKIRNEGLFWAEFARKHYKVELELVKDSTDPFKFDWEIYKPKNKA